MKNFVREYPLLALCGLNCGLCTMHLGGHCPGCGGGDGNQSCSIARCSQKQCVEFCIHCKDYPCSKYDEIDAYDSFISKINMHTNLETVARIGVDAYKAELGERISLLTVLLECYNDGRHKSHFCTAVNLLELDALREIMVQLSAEVTPELSLKEKAKLAAAKFDAAAQAQGISLKMRKKK